MAFAGNKLFYGENLAGQTVSAPRPADGDPVTFNASGYAEIDPADTALVAAAQAQGAVLVDNEGTQEAVTADTVQTATTLSALYLDNDAGDCVIRIREDSDSGAILAGPFTIEASKTRILVFPTPLTAGTGIFIEYVSGDLEATEGFLIP